MAINITILYTKMALIFKPAMIGQGKGARVMRIIGNQYIKTFDPFLMLDYAKVKLPTGFPDHPHRGFQTVSYILQGSFYHEDSKGNKGKRGAGDVQWMSAGKGIVHSQVPGSFEQESIGFQLWVNLQKKNKMMEPTYQQYPNDKIEVFKKDKVEVKIISGKWQGKAGPIYARTPSYYFDIHILPGGVFQLPISGEWNTLIFVHEGSVHYQDKNFVGQLNCCRLHKTGKKQEFVHKFSSEKGGKFILVGGQPLNEPIAQKGPFVMNTKEELQQAFEDYYGFKNGFESAKNWESTIKQLTKGKTPKQLGL